MVFSPPMPEEISTPNRSASTFSGVSPACWYACLAAMMANWVNGSIRLAALASMYSATGRSFTSPASLTFWLLVS